MTLLLDERRLRMLEEFGIQGFAVAAARPAPAAAREEAAAEAVAVLEEEAGFVRQDEPAAFEPARPPARPAAAPVAMPVPVPGRARPEGVAAMDWDQLAEAVRGCRACKLCDSRRNTVFGVGATDAEWLVVGEAPGEQEDLQGEPFVGQAGKLLDNMLAALGLRRGKQVYIANVLKCRPPHNRNPEPEEIAQCEGFLRRQVELLQPKIILAMGRFAVQALLQSNEPIGRLRGKVHHYQGIPVVVTYHPSYLLRSLPEKARAWTDLVLARSVFTRAGR